MCNCGHDSAGEATSLKKKAAVTAAGATCLTAIPAVLATGQSHHDILLTVIAAQLVLLGRAAYLMRQSRQILAACH